MSLKTLRKQVNRKVMQRDLILIMIFKFSMIKSVLCNLQRSRLTKRLTNLKQKKLPIQSHPFLTRQVHMICQEEFQVFIENFIKNR